LFDELPSQVIHPDDEIIALILGVSHSSFQKPNMEIFCDKQHDKKEIAIGKPILEKPEKRQQSKTTDHFVNIQSHVYSYSHEYEEYDIENDPEFFHEWLSDIFGVLSQDMKIICINAKIIFTAPA
jgi:hypothetical protein